MKIKLKWTLPGDFTGGIMIFGIMFAIAIIELYVIKGFQAAGMKGGGGGGPMISRTSTVSVGSGGAGPHCTRKGGTMLCPEVTKSNLARRRRFR